jgi:hypothetical protein
LTTAFRSDSLFFLKRREQTRRFMVKRVSLLLLLILVGALPVLAQMPMMRMPHVPNEFKIPPVGSWCEYTILDEEGSDTIIFKYSLPGKEKYGDDECHWFEFQVKENDELNVIKMLISGDPQEQGNLKRLIIKSGDEPAIEIPVGMMQASAEESAEEEEKEESEEPETGRVEVGKETIETQAGRIECTHFRVGPESEHTDLWITDTVPFFSLARLTSKDMTMELRAYGDSGAKSAITEEPQQMPMPGMPGEDE